MKVKLNEFVKLKDGNIAKIIKIDEKDPVYHNQQTYIIDECVKMSGLCSNLIYSEDIINHNFNIIELIKLGDIVNGIPIYAIQESNGVKCIKTILDETLYNDDIKTILTKEQIERRTYYVN